MTTATLTRPATQPTAAADQTLTRDRVFHAARKVAERDGYTGLSMRALAHELGVSTMAAYRHTKGGKAEIHTTLVTGCLEAGVPLDATAVGDARSDTAEVIRRVTATWGFLERIHGLRITLTHDSPHVQAWVDRATLPVHWLPDERRDALREGLIATLIGAPTAGAAHVTAAALVDYLTGPEEVSGA